MKGVGARLAALALAGAGLTCGNEPWTAAERAETAVQAPSAYTEAVVHPVPGQSGFAPPYRHGLQRNFGAYTHDDVSWQELRDGLGFARIKVYSDGVPVDSLAMVRADPERNAFRVFYDGNDQKTVEEWQEETGAEVMFNSSYYGYDTENAYTFNTIPVTLIVTDGVMRGPKVNKKVAGMFVAEPRDSTKPRAKVIDMSAEGYDYRNNIWDTGVQSWPMLLRQDGKIGTGKSEWYANRTVVCEDEEGSIVALTTEGGFFSLYELGRFLRESRLGIRKALNLDGGYEADMAVNTPAMRYVTYGQWETQGSRDISVPGARIILPGVIGIFPRKN